MARPKKTKSSKKKGKEEKLPAKAQAALVPNLELPSTRDSLDAYLANLRRYPLLSPKKEFEVAKRAYDHKDREALQILILSNLRLVVKIANDYLRSGFSLLDLIQEGNIGLLQAVKEYNPYKGVKFSSYASYWIKAYIRSFILRNWSLVKMGTTRAQRALFYRLQKEKNQLEAMGIVPEARRLAEKFQVKESEVEEMDQRLSGRDISLSTPIRKDSEEGDSLIQFLEDSQISTDERLANEEIRREFESRLDSFERSLSGRELVIFRERLRSDNPKTLQDIGNLYGITRERVRQIEARVLEKLKEYMKENASFMENVIDVSKPQESS